MVLRNRMIVNHTASCLGHIALQSIVKLTHSIRTVKIFTQTGCLLALVTLGLFSTPRRENISKCFPMQILQGNLILLLKAFTGRLSLVNILICFCRYLVRTTQPAGSEQKLTSKCEMSIRDGGDVKQQFQHPQCF